MSGDLHELRRLGAEVDATIPKPFDIDRLFEILSEMCSRNPQGCSDARHR